MRKLSDAQDQFLVRLVAALDGRSQPPWGNRAAGRGASAWHRTSESLVRLGLVRVERKGDWYSAVLTLVAKAYLLGDRS